jgi:hypothetical protein
MHVCIVDLQGCKVEIRDVIVEAAVSEVERSFRKACFVRDLGGREKACRE